MAAYILLSPIIREPDASGRHTLGCSSSLDVIMADNDILDLVFDISPYQKLNGIPFGMAVSRITGQLGKRFSTTITMLRLGHLKLNVYFISYERAYTVRLLVRAVVNLLTLILTRSQLWVLGHTYRVYSN